MTCVRIHLRFPWVSAGHSCQGTMLANSVALHFSRYSSKSKLPVLYPALELTYCRLPFTLSLSPVDYFYLPLQIFLSQLIAQTQPSMPVGIPWEPTAHPDQWRREASCRTSPIPLSQISTNRNDKGTNDKQQRKSRKE